jgi:flagellar protein FlgJ
VKSEGAAPEMVAVPDAIPAMAIPAAPAIKESGAAPGSFVDKLWPHALDAARSLGVAPHFLIAHAALETGWGKHELKAADGTASNNLFNIKAGGNWDGKTVLKEVTEYVNGKPVNSLEKFRAYDTPAESFADYANLLGSNPRYAGVLNQDAEGFVSGLQKGGFATDPTYADKLRRIIGSATLRLGLVG